MSKLDEAKSLLKSLWAASNAELAARIGCDEGLVRKARPLVRVELLEEENARLKDELGQYRRAVRPRPRKHDDAEPLPLWERIEEGEIIPTVPILESNA